MFTVRVRLPNRLKVLVSAAAKRAGTTVSQFMLDAIAEKTIRIDRSKSLQDLADDRFARILASGEALPWKTVRAKLAAMRSEVLGKATLRAAARLGIHHPRLARVLGITSRSISRLGRGTYALKVNSRSWRRALLVVRLHRALETIMAGDPEAMRSWFRSHHTELRATPALCLTTAAGLAKVTHYVEAALAKV